MIEKLSTLALCWIASRRKPGRVGELRRALHRAVEHRLTRPEWPAVFERVLLHLRTNGFVQDGVLALSERGERELRTALGVTTLPRGATYRGLRAQLAAHLRGARTPAADALRASVLQSGLGLTTSRPPTLASVANAIAWRAVGRDDDAPFTREAVVRIALERHLGPTRGTDVQIALQRLAATLCGARRTSADELRRAVLQAWIDGSEPGAGALADFAERVLRVARESRTGRFGEHLVFVSHVLEALRRTGAALPDDQQKRRLAEAHQAGLLKLSRADLVEAMDPSDVAASEIAFQGSTFHFVRI